MNAFLHLIRREIWEHGALWMVPAVTGALLVLLSMVLSVNIMDAAVHASAAGDLPSSEELPAFLAMITLASAGLFGLVMSFVVSFYLLDCLLADRKDRSVLFWKSLPVSDLKTVLSKLATACVVAPLIGLVASVVTTLLLLVVFSVDLALLDMDPWQILWAPNPLFSTVLLITYALVVEVLWYLPLIGYLLLVSAFAKRAVLAWAVLPPLLISLLEQLALGTRHFTDLMVHRLHGIIPSAFDGDGIHMRHTVESGDTELNFAAPALDMIQPGNFLADPGLWSGLLAAALFVSGAVWLRRYRDESL